MSVSALTSQSSTQSQQSLLTKDLQKNGLSVSTANTISSQIETVVNTVTSGASPTSSTPTDVRAAIDAQIKTDVSNGTLTQDQADAVTKTLNAMDAQQAAQGSPPQQGGSASGGAGGSQSAPAGRASGGGGTSSSSSASKTVKDETSTTSASGVITTVITYTDGTTSTQVTYGSPQQSSLGTMQSLLKSATSETGADHTKTSMYLTSLLTGGLVDTTA